MEDADWSTKPREILRNELPDLGFEVTDFIEFPLDTSNFRPIYGDIEDQDVDGCLCLTVHAGTTSIAQWNDLKPSFEFGGINVPLQFPFIWDALDGGAEYGWTLNYGLPGVPITEVATDFNERFPEEFDYVPIAGGYSSYDAITLYSEYAEHLSSTDPGDLIPAMESNELNITTTQQLSWEFQDENHESHAHDPLYDKDRWLSAESVPFFQQWQDGEIVPIAPDELATADYRRPDWM
jgi:hypothetical protein